MLSRVLVAGTRSSVRVLSGFALLALASVVTTTGCGVDAVGAPEPPPPPAEPSPVFQPQAPEAPPAAKPFCAEATGEYIATREPSNVLFLFDRSGSMHIQLPSKSTRWQATKAGFLEVLGVLPPSVGAGLMLFPQGDAPVNAWCSIDPKVNDVRCKSGWPEPSEKLRCDATQYTANVPSGLLTASQIEAMKDQVTASDASFYWGTPLATALTAAIDTQRASALAGAKSVILLTDGNPTSCGDSGISNDIQNVVHAASKGLEGKDIVRTFVIGLTDSSRQAAKAENLSAVAVAGGTSRKAGCESDNSCFYKLGDATFASDLQHVFQEISLQAFDCTFNLPAASAETDPSLINVQLSSSAGVRAVGRDATHENGWDYLPNGTQIQLYGGACKAMKDEAAKLKIVLGCKTVIEPAAPSPK